MLQKMANCQMECASAVVCEQIRIQTGEAYRYYDFATPSVHRWPSREDLEGGGAFNPRSGWSVAEPVSPRVFGSLNDDGSLLSTMRFTNMFGESHVQGMSRQRLHSFCPTSSRTPWKRLEIGCKKVSREMFDAKKALAAYETTSWSFAGARIMAQVRKQRHVCVPFLALSFDDILHGVIILAI